MSDTKPELNVKTEPDSLRYFKAALLTLNDGYVEYIQGGCSDNAGIGKLLENMATLFAEHEAVLIQQVSDQRVQDAEAKGGIKVLDEIDSIIEDDSIPSARAWNRIGSRTITIRARLEDHLRHKEQSK